MILLSRRALNMSRLLANILLIIVCSNERLLSTNPAVSNFMVNLSSPVNKEATDDTAPEMVIEGNTIHLVWMENKNGVVNPLYYCRSIDLGKTWETPKLVANLKNNEYSQQPITRKLAVDGNNVYIGFCDYDYSDGMSGRVFLFRSVNGGSSFDAGKELSKGGKVYGSHIKAAKGKVAVAYFGSGAKNGLRMLASADGGSVFTEKLISEEPNGISDFWFDGSQMIVVSEYTYYYYGLNIGKVFVSISNDNSATFTTNKVSVTFNESPTVVREKCRCYYDGHYAPKIAKSGTNIHVVFTGYNEKIEWTTFYVRSTNNGQTFEKAVDINNAALSGGAIQTGMESVVAKNENVYIAYQSTGGSVYFTGSANNGDSFEKARSVLYSGTTHIESTWYPGIALDPNDATGSNLYISGQFMSYIKSTDKGKSFSGSAICAPFLHRNITSAVSDMAIDSKGTKHWISAMKYWYGTDIDIFYRRISPQPEPGIVNKSLMIVTIRNPSTEELVIVPSSKTLNFDTLITAEAWVKFDPSTEESLNILSKSNGYDGYDSSPSGYHMGFRKTSGKMCFNAGIETDKGDFVNWSDCNINDTLWHHIAFTYDAGGGPNNFKSYVDGLLTTQQSVTGKITSGDGFIMIGSRNPLYGSAKYHVDNLRLWNKALTQEELLTNQVKTFTGKESGLKMFLSFDDTYKDLSGNGNDALPLYLGILKTSGFNPPVPAFDIYQNMNQASITNKTLNGKTYQWSFGDGTKSDKGNPVYSYSKAGEYNITLEAMNANSKTALIKRTTVKGLSHIEPTKAGNYGSTAISVFGGGLTVDGTTVMLRKTGNPDVVGSNLVSPFLGVLTAIFDLNNLSLGKWDLVVKKGTTETTLPGAFEVLVAEMPKTWVNFTGGATFLPGRWVSYTINYGNSGNIDAFFVPLVIAISDNGSLEIDKLDFKVGNSGSLSELVGKDGVVTGTEIFNGKKYNTKTISFIIPVIQANTSISLHLRIKANETFFVRTWDLQPLIENNADFSKILKSAQAWPSLKEYALCLGEAALDETLQYALQKLLSLYEPIKELAACFAAGGKQIINMNIGEKTTAGKFVFNVLGVSLDCLHQEAKVAIENFILQYTGIKEGMLALKAMLHAISCLLTGKPLKSTFLDAAKNMVFSKDPNEMIGPSGYDNQNWIQMRTPLPYTILFENKSDATAPAHDVYITDTLDLKKIDLKEFGFGSFGFGDTVLIPAGTKLKSFSMDVELRPKKNLITRVSGKLDTLKGVITWEFLSLNPSTLMLEEDPLTGFLPPNNSNHAGEGFVSFSVGLKKELTTNTTLKNKASIVFDVNKPIMTNEFVNTLDLDKPQSKVDPLDATIDSRFPVSWNGTDIGSGIHYYNIYVLENDTSVKVWKRNTQLKTAEFEGKVGSAYKFYSVATDNVSLVENNHSTYDAFTRVIVGIDQLKINEKDLEVFPNPVTDNLVVRMVNAPFGVCVVEVFKIDGQIFFNDIFSQAQISSGVNIKMDNATTGQYIVRMISENKCITKKISVQ